VILLKKRYFLFSFFLLNLIQIQSAHAADFTDPIIALESKAYTTVNVDNISSDLDATTEIQTALNKAKNSPTPIKVVVKKGTYTISRPLSIFSNTWLKTDKNTVFNRPKNAGFILLLNGVRGDKTIKAYNGNSNIIIDGGIWNVNGDKTNKGLASGFGLAHGSNLLIENVTIKNLVNSHGIDLVGNNGVLVRNSRFLGYLDTTDEQNRGYAEAIQVDGDISPSSFGQFGAIDGTVSKNIRVQNNEFNSSFENGMGAQAVGIGSHSGVDGKPFTNIQILNNHFIGSTYSAIHGYNWQNVIISGNVFTNVNKGVFIDHTTKEVYIDLKTKKEKTSQIKFRPSAYITISSNHFYNIKSYAIELDGEKTPLRPTLDLVSYINYATIKNNNFGNVPLANKLYLHDVLHHTSDLYYHILSNKIVGGTITKEIVDDLRKNTNYTIHENVLQFIEVYRIRGSFKTYNEANEMAIKIQKTGSLETKGTITKVDGKYQVDSYGIIGKEKATQIYNKLNNHLLSIIDAKKQVAICNIDVGNFTDYNQAKNIANNFKNKYGWSGFSISLK
jgi:hypothetical protein